MYVARRSTTPPPDSILPHPSRSREASVRALSNLPSSFAPTPPARSPTPSIATRPPATPLSPTPPRDGTPRQLPLFRVSSPSPNACDPRTAPLLCESTQSGLPYRAASGCATGCGTRYAVHTPPPAPSDPGSSSRPGASPRDTGVPVHSAAPEIGLSAPQSEATTFPSVRPQTRPNFPPQSGRR